MLDKKSPILRITETLHLDLDRHGISVRIDKFLYIIDIQGICTHSLGAEFQRLHRHVRKVHRLAGVCYRPAVLDIHHRRPDLPLNREIELDRTLG